MTAEPEVIEVEEEPRALAIREQPRGLSVAVEPTAIIDLATRMATALRDIVDRQHLFATIRGKKYPQVEAWMTIARMDNVVAREEANPIRHEDGSYEAMVELVRLSDGMVIGRASALCGTSDDAPWHERSEPARRSMAVTRATSRAFRQQYSWIMALAGYEPTPAEEMPRDSEPTPPDEPEMDHGGLIGTATIGKGKADFLLRPGPDGPVLSFKLVSGRKNIQVVVTGANASALDLAKADVLGKRVTVWGKMRTESWTPKDAKRPISYLVCDMERIQTPDWILPAEEAVDPPSVPIWDDIEADLAAAAT